MLPRTNTGLNALSVYKKPLRECFLVLVGTSCVSVSSHFSFNCAEYGITVLRRRILL